MKRTKSQNSLQPAGRKLAAAALMAVAALTLSSTAFAAVDGTYNSADGYTNVNTLNFQLDNGKMVKDTGTLAWRVDSAGNVFVAFVQPLSINDNTYGANAIGWDSADSKKTGHSFGDLTGSDKAHFDFTNAAGQTVLSFNLDYISGGSGGGGKKGGGDTSGVFMSLGVTGGDGSVQVGNASSVIQWGTSLDYNLNTIAGRGTNNGAPGLGYSQYTTDSPAATPQRDAQGNIDYSKPYLNSAAPGWDYTITYEIMISKDAFGTSGFGGVDVPYAHDSPSKFGQNTIPVVPVPEPSTYLGGFALIALLIGTHAKAVLKKKKLEA